MVRVYNILFGSVVVFFFFSEHRSLFFRRHIVANLVKDLVLLLASFVFFFLVLVSFVLFVCLILFCFSLGERFFSSSNASLIKFVHFNVGGFLRLFVRQQCVCTSNHILDINVCHGFFCLVTL